MEATLMRKASVHLSLDNCVFLRKAEERDCREVVKSNTRRSRNKTREAETRPL